MCSATKAAACIRGALRLPCFFARGRGAVREHVLSQGVGRCAFRGGGATALFSGGGQSRSLRTNCSTLEPASGSGREVLRGWARGRDVMAWIHGSARPAGEAPVADECNEGVATNTSVCNGHERLSSSSLGGEPAPADEADPRIQAVALRPCADGSQSGSDCGVLRRWVAGRDVTAWVLGSASPFGLSARE